MGINEIVLGDLTQTSTRQEAAHMIEAGQALAVDNGLVFALWGDGGNPDFKNKVALVKGTEANKPFGLTLPYEQFLEFVDLGRLSPDIAKLFEDPSALASRSGALMFWRLPGRNEVKDSLPATVWSIGEDNLPVVQNWSPEGKANIIDMLGIARQLGVDYPAVTSLNTTKEPEITDSGQAKIFAREHDLSLVTDVKTKKLMSGSYPVVIGNSEGLQVGRARPNSIGTLVLSRLLAGYPLNWDDSQTVQPGWDSADLQKLQGPELRQTLLSKLGWTANRETQ